MKENLALSMPIGEQLSGIPYPVFFDPHFALSNNKPPGTFINGSPGSGKTFFALLIAAHASILGKTSIIIDPKGDFIALKKLEDLGISNKVNIWNLVSQTDEGSSITEENEGILDPTSFYDKAVENVSLTIDVIKDLMGGSLTSVQSNYLTPIVQDVCNNKTPTLKGVISKLMRNEKDEVRNLGIKLENMTRTNLAKLLSTGRKTDKKAINLRDGTTVVNLMGLTLPLDTKPRETWSEAESISTTIMTLITKLVFETMKSIKSLRKLLIVDEAWSVMSTGAGRTMISSIGLLGRSLNMALVLVSQSPKHIEVKEGASLNTAISVRFAFRNNSEEDNLITIKAMGLPEDDGWETICPTLNTGQCLMQDSNNKHGVVQIMTPDAWVGIFNTNPATILDNT